MRGTVLPRVTQVFEDERVANQSLECNGAP